MNLINLLRVMPTSVRLRNDQQADSGGGLSITYSPPVRLEKEDKSLSETTPDSPPVEGNETQTEEIDNTKTIKLFEDDGNFIDDLLKLAKVWNQITATDSMELNEKRREIARWLGGKRNIDDIMMFMELLADNVDISNSWLNNYLNNAV